MTQQIYQHFEVEGVDSYVTQINFHNGLTSIN